MTARSLADAEILCQGERLGDKEIDGFLLGVNNVYRIVYQYRADLNEAKRILKMTSEAAKKGDAVDIGQIDGFLGRKW